MSRPALSKGYERSLIEIDLQPGGAGNAWEWAGCVMGDAVTVPQQGVTRREGPDPAGNGFLFAGFVRGEQGNVTLSLTMRRNRRNALEGLLNCPFNIRARYRCDGRRDDTHNWESFEGACNAVITEIGRSGWSVMESGQNDDYVNIPISIEAGAWFEYGNRVVAERIEASLVAADINKIRYYDWVSCGDCDRNPSDGCQIWNAVTDADVGPYNEPYFIVYDGTQASGSETTLYAITPFGTGDDVVDFVRWGDVVVAISPAGGFARSTDGGATWTALTVTGAPVNAPRALYASARQFWAVGDNGYIWRSTDAGATWSVEDAGVATAENLASVDGYGDTVIVAVGASNAAVRTKNGGKSWAALTGPSAGDGLAVVRIPRRGEVYVGNDTGELYRGTQYGEAWSLIETFGGGAGTVQDIAFCGPCGEGLFAYLLHNPAGSSGQVYRSLDGGVEWRAIQGTIPTNSGLNSVACCDHSDAVAVGDIQATYGVILEIDPEEL